jgi:hypothetical protein
LRLARIALLELPHHQRRKNGHALDQDANFNAGRLGGDAENIDESKIGAMHAMQEAGYTEDAAMEAWRRLGSRVMNVTTVRPDTLVPDVEPEDCVLQRSQHPHVCLGDLMEESISWIDVDSEDDQTSPKQSDLMQAAAMQEEQEQVQEPMPRGFEAIARQQRAPGIVAGMCKCLSF